MIIGWAVIQYECVLILRGEVWTQRPTCTWGERHVKLQAETGAMHVLAKEFQ